MHRLITRFVPFSLLMIALIVVGPAMGTAQTPASPVPQEGPGFDITVLGVSRYQENAAELDRNGDPIERNHALLEITMQPGVVLPAFIGTQSTVIHVASGELQVTVNDGEGLVHGPGGTSGPCGEEACAVNPGEDIVLNAGETIALTDASFVLGTQDEASTAFQMTILVPVDDVRYRCWICPVIG
jgi:hypothetical protein